MVGPQMKMSGTDSSHSPVSMRGELLLFIWFGDLNDHLLSQYVDCFDCGLLGLSSLFGLLLDISDGFLL